MQQNRFAKYANSDPIIKPADPLKPGQVTIQSQNITGNALDNSIKGAKVPFAKSDAVLDNRGKGLSNKKDELTITEKAPNPFFDREKELASRFEGQPAVKTYKDAATSLATMLRTPDNGGGDVQIIYNFIKSQGPGPVAQGELELANSVASFTESLERQYGKLGNGNRLPARVRMELIESARQAVAAKKAQFDQIYKQYRSDAARNGLNPESVTGPHPADAVRPEEEKYIRAHGGTPHSASDPAAPAPAGGVNLPPNPKEGDSYSLGGIDFTYENGDWVPGLVGGSKGKPPAQGYEDSYLSQGLSGINQGLATLAGAPVDIATGVLNLGSTGINALTNAQLPQIKNPTLGSQQIAGFLGDYLGAIAPPSTDPSKQFVRRVGESVGAAALPAMGAGNLARAGGQVLAGVTGGIGGATAQQLFPGNPVAEFAGETLGSLGGAAGFAGLRQRAQQRAIEAAVPTVDQLKTQAGNLYRQAEANGVTADPAMTRGLAENLRGLLAREGTISPTGRLSEVHPKVKEGMQLVDDYAGQAMSPTQLQTVRSVLADGLQSKEKKEGRLAGLMLDAFDQWADPLAPELPQARSVASRYLTAEQLEKARELAGARAGQFTGSGFENALRTEYRALDRGAIKGSQRFGEDVGNAVERVSRGTPASNAARGLGKLAPTGVVSFGLGSGLPAMAAGSVGGPVAAGLVGGAMAGTGIAGRAVATQMGIRNATLAELVARNGGALPQAPLMTLGDLQDAGRFSAAEMMKYLQPREY